MPRAHEIKKTQTNNAAIHIFFISDKNGEVEIQLILYEILIQSKEQNKKPENKAFPVFYQKFLKSI